MKRNRLNILVRWSFAVTAVLAFAALPRLGRADDHAAPVASTAKAEPVGASTCLGCHADRESFNKNIHAKAWPQAKGIEFEQSCETCHGPGSLHAGAGGDKSNPEFFSIKNPGAHGGRDSAASCLKCHAGGKRMHWVASKHEGKGVSCANCHSIHGTAANDGKSPLLKKESELETCFQCHADKKAQIKKPSHMPLLEGKMSCSACHNPHGSTTEKLLARNNVTETCYECHADKRGPFLWEHPPARENCLTCHNPHGSINEKMLTTKAPLLCQRCHAGIKHPATIYEGRSVAGNTTRALIKGCVNCHSRVHGSNHPSGRWLIR